MCVRVCVLVTFVEVKVRWSVGLQVGGGRDHFTVQLERQVIVVTIWGTERDRLLCLGSEGERQWKQSGGQMARVTGRHGNILGVRETGHHCYQLGGQKAKERQDVMVTFWGQRERHRQEVMLTIWGSERQVFMVTVWGSDRERDRSSW